MIFHPSNCCTAPRRLGDGKRDLHIVSIVSQRCTHFFLKMFHFLMEDISPSLCYLEVMIQDGFAYMMMFILVVQVLL